MDIADLAGFEADSQFEADLVIVGGGPAGLTIAREFIGTSARVLVLESGELEQTSAHAALAELESIGEPKTDEQIRKRSVSHGESAPNWSHEIQPFGLRCRALGGSTHAWAGKSAAFDPIDFDARPWVAFSGWPIGHAALNDYLDRAADVLNLGPNVYDDRLWDLIGIPRPKPSFDQDGLRSFFWQFARSRVDPLDIMRFGREFVTLKAENVRVLLNATVTRIDLAPDGRSFQGLEMSTVTGVRHRVKARSAVVAASAIENARLLLASNAVHHGGIGNTYDLVGRFLMDHAVSRIATFRHEDISRVLKRFGFYGVRHGGRTQMYMHGLALTPEIQEREQLLNAAIYFMPQRSPDDPWDALKRLLRRTSERPLQDMRSLVTGAGLLATGIGTRILSSGVTPDHVKKFIVETAIRYFPNFVVEEFQDRGVPHKLTEIAIDAISEQRPDRESRIMLSERTDRLGIPIARADWRINDDERRTIVRIAQIAQAALARHGLPTPILNPWVADQQIGAGVIIDFGHTLGTTRMSSDPKSGVVDADCRVHGVRGLYIAGGSVFPTSGHANPTLVILALAIRLADRIKQTFVRET
jgi:choline dehydrogenase-like flavoprotein